MGKKMDKAKKDILMVHFMLENFMMIKEMEREN